jgi:hypothetical protein
LLNSKVVTVPNDAMYPRDKGKNFLITEMPAYQAEKWAMRAFLALKGSESQIPLEVKNLGMVGVAIIGINVFLRASVNFQELSPLLDEMFTCVKALPNPQDLNSARSVIEGEILDVPTLGWLRSQVLELHTGFDCAGALSKLILEVSTTAASLTT